MSHSWVSEERLQRVSTTINGKAWPVPIPFGASLDAVRVELLSHGAEYVFLDVLCLRQKDSSPELESLRKTEWKLDVPTIGSVYQQCRQYDIPVIIYFNGLGLPFVDNYEYSKDRFHWCNRVWTLQECPGSKWLIGGVSPANQTLFREHARALISKTPLIDVKFSRNQGERRS